MEYVDIKTKKLIKTIPISKDKFDKLLGIAGIALLSDITENSARLLVKTIVLEYKKGSLSLDELSSSFGKVYEKTIYNNDFREINEILEIGSDLSYTERMSDNAKQGKDFSGYLEAVLNF